MTPKYKPSNNTDLVLDQRLWRCTSIREYVSVGSTSGICREGIRTIVYSTELEALTES